MRNPFPIASLLGLSTLLAACGENPKTGNDALRTETEVIDVRISESTPDKGSASESGTRVGFDASGRETRMLLHFPGLLRLWDEAVVVSSIAEVLLQVNCTSVPVNPENILLLPLEKPWTTFATWKSPFGILPGNGWKTPGGDTDETLTPLTPSIRTHPGNEKAFQMAFDLTGLVREMIVAGRKNHGFLIRVRRSQNNAADAISFVTGNSPEEAMRPTSVLTFSTTEGISP